VEAIHQECYERGVVAWTGGRYGNVLRVMPPLVTTEHQIEVGLDVMVDVIESHADTLE
jgi:diaminobutyrate-2-oxoglutarate transaminase